MKKYIAIAILMTLGIIKSPSLKAQYGFGGATEEHMQITRYDKDPEAEALVLVDVGESYFSDNRGVYEIFFTRIKRIKIFTKAGIKYATVSIPFYIDGLGKSEDIRSIEANSYNYQDGTIVKTQLDPGSVYEEVLSEKWKVKKFVIPNVREGSLIEFKYVLVTPFHFNLPDWEFQGPIPTLFSQYVANMIPFYEYMFIIQGTPKLDIQTSVRSSKERIFGSVTAGSINTETGFKFFDIIYTFGMKDVPAFRDEAYITSPKDYIIKLDFQLARYHSPRGGTTEVMTTWPKMTEDFLKVDEFGGYIKKCKKPAEDALAGLKDLQTVSDKEKCRKIIEYVKTNLKWNGYYGKFAVKTPKELFNEKVGNPAEINLFMVAMLTAAGFDAYPLILSTRDNGKINSDYPFESFFNYVIAAIYLDDRIILADATEPLLSYDQIPTRCINDNGLLIKRENLSWINLVYGKISSESKAMDISIYPETFTASATVSIKANEFEAYKYKTAYHNDKESIAEKLNENKFINISDLKTFNFDDASKPYIISFKAETEVEHIGRQIIISPFLHFPISENKLIQNTRTYPVDMIYPSSNNFFASINIPDGFKAFNTPENFFLDNDLMTISLKYILKDAIVEVNGNYTFKKAVYKASEYSRIRFYINNIVDLFNKNIVIEEI
jgi:hypothetical protein